MDPFIGEIRLFAGSFAPVDWAFCNGQLVPIRQYTALFSILGTTYGGDGVNTFGLPDLRDRVPVHQGQGPGLTNRVIGEAGGIDSVQLTVEQMPNHSHLPACGTTADRNEPTNAVWANTGRMSPAVYANSSNLMMNQLAVQPAGSSGVHNNRQPYQGIYYIIALNGIFPPRS